MFEPDPTIGHRDDASFEQLNDAIFEATLAGDERQIMRLQQDLRERFGHLL